jgi:hypothetical protein
MGLKNIFLTSIFKNRSNKKSDQLMLEEFDHEWFRTQYNIDETDKNRLFAIYKKLVRAKQVSPNPDFNEKLYLLRYPDVKSAVTSGKFLCGFEHYVLHGKNEGRSGKSDVVMYKDIEKIVETMETLFDEDWYLKTYPEVLDELKERNLNPFQHYLKIGHKRKYSPNNWFDEDWYRSFYEDVNEFVENGIYICGFEHFLKAGRFEGRLPKFKLKDILNFKFKDAIAPVGISQWSVVYGKMEVNSIKVTQDNKIRINFVVPTMDKAIMFGGYIALQNIIKKVLKLDVDVRFLICEDFYLSKSYFWYLWDKEFGQYKDKIEFQNILVDPLIEIKTSDIYFSYSAMTTLFASHLAKHTERKKVIYLIQEDERVFLYNNSIRFLIDYVYTLPVTFLFNSGDLINYFKKYSIGPFSSNANPMAKVYFFDSVYTDIIPPSTEEMKSKKERNLIFYARPEAHASRNLFEVGITALKLALENKYFDHRWNFIGIGAADKYRLDIYKGRILEIKPKMSIEEYKSLLQKGDVGLFLMYAPHPGLVGFEMASAGMIVVVNKFDYRDENYFKEKSKNFIPADPDPYSIADALKKAVLLCENFDERIQNAYTPKIRDWDEAIPDEMIEEIIFKD